MMDTDLKYSLVVVASIVVANFQVCYSVESLGLSLQRVDL